ncbi:hypothetical protein [Paenibacillus alginolyticus]|nr:hypothetical protein [Paenibacillus alginolyticus]MEC0144729.1 hypothetical protein [Paenibacillus alginolyticus]
MISAVDRIVGHVPNQDNALDALAAWNSRLNKHVPDPATLGKPSHVSR